MTRKEALKIVLEKVLRFNGAMEYPSREVVIAAEICNEWYKELEED